MEHRFPKRLHKKRVPGPTAIQTRYTHISHQETMLNQQNKLFIKGGKIYSSNNQTRGKGVAVLISPTLK